MKANSFRHQSTLYAQVLQMKDIQGCHSYQFSVVSVRSAIMKVLEALLLIFLVRAASAADPAILEQKFDPFRSGFVVDHHLTSANVNYNSFGETTFFPTDGQVYAQLLSVPNLQINASSHNVLFSATQHSSVYALDLDTGATLWQRSFLIDGPILSGALSPANGGCFDISPEYGFTSTPVIDLTASTMYIMSWLLEHGNFTHRLHALDLATGLDKANSPSLPFAASVTFPGAAAPITFNSLFQLQRAGLALVNGTIFIAFGSHCDQDTWFPWVFGYDATTLAQKYVFVTPREDGLGPSIWMAGTAPAVLNGELFVVTGNGFFSPPTDFFGDSVLKLSTRSALLPGLPTSLNVADFFTPSNQLLLQDNDLDFGSGGAVVIAGGQFVVAVGKAGTLFVCNTSSLGGYTPPPANNAAAEIDPTVHQYIPGATTTGFFDQGVYGSPSWWAGGSALFVHGVFDVLKKYSFNTSTGLFATTPSAQTTLQYPFPGAVPVISADSPTSPTAIVWDLQRNGDLYAFDAGTLAPLWSGSGAMAGCNTTQPNLPKFVVPIVAAGRVCYGCSNGVVCYGMYQSPGSIGNGTLGPNQSLKQGGRLYSPDGRVYLNLQDDGNLVLYDRLQHPIWNSGTFGVSPTPFTVIMQLDCNLVEYTGNQAAVYSSGTYNVANKPCSLVVSSTQGGNIFVVDATGKAVFSAPNPLPSPPTSAPPASSAAPVTSAPPATTSKAPATSVAPPTTPPVSFGSGTLLAGQDLQQGVPLYSPDGGAYLLAQADGNLVLYSKAGSPVWASGTYGATPQPFLLAMQADCNLVLYDENIKTQGRNAGTAVYASGTYNQGTGCRLVVNSASGGSISIISSTGLVYRKP